MEMMVLYLITVSSLITKPTLKLEIILKQVGALFTGMVKMVQYLIIVLSSTTLRTPILILNKIAKAVGPSISDQPIIMFQLVFF